MSGGADLGPEWRGAQYNSSLTKLGLSGPEEERYLSENPSERHSKLAKLYSLRREVSSDCLRSEDKEELLSRIRCDISAMEGSHPNENSAVDVDEEPGGEIADTLKQYLPNGPNVLYFIGGALFGHLLTGWYDGRQEKDLSERAKRDAMAVSQVVKEIISQNPG
jgi:hypothetical protein